MAATFETRVLENGVWVTRTAGIDAAIQSTSGADEIEDDCTPPACALLSTTVLESPQVHKILSVRLRSKVQNDIAFIGDHTITIRELLKNGQTHDVLRHTGFGQRIRNAVVIGESPEESQNHSEQDHDTNLSLDNIGSMADSIAHSRPPFPPQMLLCILESGELVSLYFIDGKVVIRKISTPVQKWIPYLGYYLAVEPRSRYLVAAGFEDVVVVYELELWATLRHRYESTGSTGDIIKSLSYQPMRATILDVQFLFPRPQDESHIILMALTCSKSRDGHSEAKQRYTVWDWDAGEDLSERMKLGQRQPIVTSSTPLFCIPLRAQHSFYIVCEHDIVLVKQTLSGAGERPESIPVNAEITSVHHGQSNPLWTAWARPFRRENWFVNSDVIYLAREDGKVQSIEIDAETLIASINEAGDDGEKEGEEEGQNKGKNDGLGVNIGTAFATTFGTFEDIIIVGGNSGPGGIWQIKPRDFPQKRSTIDDWAPVVDMTTTSDSLSWETVASDIGRNEAPPKRTLKRDRIFFASGRGKKGCVVEPRFGIKARIGSELDLGDPAKDVWAFPDLQLQDGSMNVVLSQPYSTQVIHLSEDFQDVVAESPDTTPFDLSSRTIHASNLCSGRVIVQVSEKAITLIAPSQRSRHSFDDILGSVNVLVEDATARDDLVAVYTSSPNGAQLHTLRIEEMAVVLIQTRNVFEEITCLEVVRISNRQLVAMGVSDDGGPSLCLCPPEDVQGEPQVLRQRLGNNTEPLEALVSMSIAREDAGAAHLVAGTRCGHLLTISIKEATSPITWATQRLGLGPVGVFPDQLQRDDSGALFATCDNALLRLSKLSVTDKARFQTKELILPVNLEKPDMMAPPVHALYAMQTKPDTTPMLLLLSQAQLYFTELDINQAAAPRILPLERSPTRIIYSELWNCLIVALTQPNDRGVELALIDPDTGASVSKPLNAEKEEGPLHSFDTPGDRVLVLREWVFWKGKRSFSFIIVGLKSGKLVVVSLDQNPQAETDPSYRRLVHSTRHRLKNLEGPVTAVVTDDQGFMCCSGKTLRRYVLEDRRLVVVKEFELDSPAVSLEIHAGNIYALTTGHSLEVIDYQSNDGDKEMTLLHCDAVTRSGTHMVQVGPPTDRSHWPLSLVASSHSAVTGIWTPRDENKREICPLFLGELSNPVRKFVRARCRVTHPEDGLRDQHGFGCLPSTADNADILGVSLNGKLRSFKLLSHELWEVLSRLQRLALRALPQTPSWSQKDNEDSMHINGDILSWFLAEERPLERMMQEQNPVLLSVEESLLQALEALDGGLHVERIRSEVGDWGLQQACELCYTILEHLLSPVI